MFVRYLWFCIFKIGILLNVIGGNEVNRIVWFGGKSRCYVEWCLDFMLYKVFERFVCGRFESKIENGEFCV